MQKSPTLQSDFFLLYIFYCYNNLQYKPDKHDEQTTDKIDLYVNVFCIFNFNSIQTYIKFI